MVLVIVQVGIIP